MSNNQVILPRQPCHERSTPRLDTYFLMGDCEHSETLAHARGAASWSPVAASRIQEARSPELQGTSSNVGQTHTFSHVNTRSMGQIMAWTQLDPYESATRLAERLPRCKPTTLAPLLLKVLEGCLGCSGVLRNRANKWRYVPAGLLATSIFMNTLMAVYNMYIYGITTLSWAPLKR